MPPRKKQLEIHEQINSVEKAEALLQARKGILLQKAITSSNPSDIIKANKMFTENIAPKENEESTRKSYLVDPYDFNQFLGYKNKPFSLSYQMLRKMSYGVPIVRSVINTRLDQITSFCEPQSNKYSTGFVIRKKRSIYDKDDKEPTKVELRKADAITEFILNCGVGNNFDGDDFDDLTRKVFNDSYSLDQLNFEVQRNRKGLPMKFFAVDAATIRIASSFDADIYDSNSILRREPIKGYYPSYCQIKDGTISADFYPWELCFGVRNPSTNIYSNGYGVCELEILVNVVTSMLWGDEYNRRFFSQGSAPKGFLKIKNGSLINNGKLGDFKQAWSSMMQGVTNSHKTPVLEGDVEWIDLQHTNRDMEFSNWQEYLIKLTCAIYRIDPAEINFPLSGGSEQKAMFEGNNEARLKHSKDKGLYPALKFWQRKLNKFLVSQIDPEFELVFVGMDGMDVGTELDQDIKMVTNFMTLDELRVRRGLKPLGEEKGGNLILNSAWMQQYTMKQQQEMLQQQQEAANAQMNYDGGNEGVEEEEDPFEKAFNSYLSTIKNAA